MDKYSTPKDYNKLVRNKKIAMIKEKGKDATFHVASEEEKYPTAMAKLQEEVDELVEAIASRKIGDIYSESADVMEIRDHIRNTLQDILAEKDHNQIKKANSILNNAILNHSLDIAKILVVKKEKLEESGGFDEWIILERS